MVCSFPLAYAPQRPPDACGCYSFCSAGFKYYQEEKRGQATNGGSAIHEHRTRSAPRSPARHEVVRLIADPSDVEPAHSHVVAVETASAGGPRPWTLVEFVRAVRLGEHFYLREGSTSLDVDPTVCERCARVTIAAIPPHRER
jgi:hypothetical protein